MCLEIAGLTREFTGTMPMTDATSSAHLNQALYGYKSGAFFVPAAYTITTAASAPTFILAISGVESINADFFDATAAFVVVEHVVKVEPVCGLAIVEADSWKLLLLS